MGAGRKTVTVTVPEKSQPQWTTNCSASARNLTKSDLGGVIFGCKYNTIKECFSNQLFGLPAPHFSYVRNIDPGLPLFLFNYSDRKLHGIFEASSHGRMNIDPFGWTGNDSDSTPYGAQVRFRIRMRCQPLEEDQFQPIIVDNYYDPRLFWFELDRHQTNQLILLFSASPVTATARPSASIQNHVLNRNNVPRGLPPPNATEECSGMATSTQNRVNLERSSSWDGLDFAREQQRLETLIDDEEPKKEEQDVLHLKQCSGLSYSAILGNTDNPPQKPWSAMFKSEIVDNRRREVEDRDASYLAVASNSNSVSSCVSPCLDGESEQFEALRIEEATELLKEEHVTNNTYGELQEVAACRTTLSEFSTSSDLHSIVAMLSLELEELKSIQSKQVQTIHSLEQDLFESKHEIQQLKDRCSMLESRTFTAVRLLYGEGSESYPKLISDSNPKCDELIVVAGGYDGSSWLSSLDSYSPSEDILNSLGNMNSARAYASAVLLNGEVYIIGGGLDDNMWYDTVESYSLVTNQWTYHPSLNQRKGSLAVVSLNDKIFTFGGGNGVQCLSEVEMLDPDAGKWIPARSMLHKRFATAAAEINGAVYVVGGYDGSDYLRSVERFDPREHSWTTLGNMTAKRGGHSVAVLNEKLYALGGHDGDKMVSSVEIFDPRASSWMMVESMKNSRGYFGAAVIKGAICVVGGLDHNGGTLDVVEYYKVGHGWHVTDLKGFGKRCFFSTIVL